MKEEIDIQRYEFEVLEIERNVVKIQNLFLYFHNQNLRIIFQIKMTQNQKILKTTKEVSDHNGNI